MTEQEALDADRKRLDACLAGDAATLEQLMAPGGLYIHTAGNIDTRDVFIEKVRSGALVYRRIDNRVETVTSALGALIIAGVLDMDVERAGVPANVHIRYSCVWIATPSGPQMVNWQATPLAR